GWGSRGRPGFGRRGLVAPLVHALPYGFRRVKTAIDTAGIDDWRERYVRWFGALGRAECDRLAASALNGASVLDSRPPFDAAPGASSLRRMLYFDQASWLPDNLLERGDRMTLAASIQARGPFFRPPPAPQLPPPPP